MFTHARIKLTGWYLLMLMTVSILFSITVYNVLTYELDRGIRMQVLRLSPTEFGATVSSELRKTPGKNSIQTFPLFDTHMTVLRERTPSIDASVFTNIRERIIRQLIVINTAILILSGCLAYILAGKTLRPIEKAHEEQKRFIADASHELRTPLTSLRTEIEVALRNTNLSTQQARDVLASNLEDVERMQYLSNALLSLHHYQEKKKRIHTEVDLYSIISTAVKYVLPSAKAKQISITTPKKHISVLGNHEGLTELVMILLDNAVKYNPNRTKITIHIEEKPHTAIVTITDTGIGISKQHLPYIFNRFFRVDTSRSTQHTTGYGLGLSIAKSIVEAHNGKIEVKSSVGKGTSFTLTLVKKHSSGNV